MYNEAMNVQPEIFDPHKHAQTMTCPYCGGSVSFRSNAVIYGREYGSGRAYICDNFPSCDSFVGAHPDIDKSMAFKPLGTLADYELRQWRKRVHALIDPYWKKKIMQRGEVYAVVTHILQTQEQAHVGQMTIEQCRLVLSRWFEYIAPLHMLITREEIRQAQSKT